MFNSPFSFKGRIGRTEFFTSFIISVFIYGFIFAIIESTNGDAAILSIFFIPILWFLYAQGTKRSHDIGNSGWFQLIPFYVFWLLLQSGEVGPNKYGEDPKGRSHGTISPQIRSQSQGNSPGGSSTSQGGYEGGYGGGHNSPINSSPQSTTHNNGEYKSGNLYN